LNTIAIIGIILLSSVFTVNTAFGEANYSILAHPRFSNQPIVCVYEPDESNARDIIKRVPSLVKI
jgi:hypothetical protein